MKKSGIIALGAMLVAGAASASNTGFKLNYPLQFFANNSNTNWMSLPTFYFPNGNVSVSQQNAIDLCADLNDFSTANPRPKVATVVKWLVSTQVPQGQSCTNVTKLAFNLVAGEGYAAVPVGPGIVVNVVGSNNDAYAPNKGGTSTYALQHFATNSNTNWHSVPYHIQADNAIDLCRMYNGAPANGSKVATVVKWLVSSQVPQGQSCTNVTKLAFNLVPGEGYAAVPASAGQTLAWDVY